MQAPQVLAGSEMVVAEFGTWPSFHDAEVISFELRRLVPANPGETEVRMTVHVRCYETRGEGTSAYHLALVKNALIAFRFVGVENLEVSEFNHQNVIDDILFTEAGSSTSARLAVDVQSNFGFGGQWHCHSAEVSSVSQGPSEA